MRFTTAEKKSKAIIDGVEITSDTLTGRGGLILFARYLRNIQIFQQIDTFFGSMRRSRKGQPITEIFKQLLCFFVDGTSRHLVYFDALAKDAGYVAAAAQKLSQAARIMVNIRCTALAPSKIGTAIGAGSKP